ncbi:MULTISPECIES: hypothetical protein [Sphingomonadaceae]|uniref:Uncharacterized protein n=1 Tax=Rhizorhabdus wittichii TaxID=160791 RepID=A0A975D8N0_9SPHN|nr:MULTISPECIES: hypothetical protein [Sphingomonadaceae]QTH24744.1 hypothetical protein HRJ34_28090 [Rhizorhabdus wittichii]QUM74505.1 hypothetical protein ICN83_19470 [Sphingopyxis granuli]
MNCELIGRLVTEEGFAFQSWQDRYGKGVWATLGFWQDHMDIVRDLSWDGEDQILFPAMDYVFSANWLPVETGRTFAEAAQNLEARLLLLPQDQLADGSEWRKLVCKALLDLREAHSGLYRNGERIKWPEPLDDLPETFEAAVEWLAASERAWVGEL